MNFRAIAIVVFLVVVSGGLLVHFRQQSITGATSTNVPVEGIPVPPPTGPYGKFVVVGESVHDFGVMELHQKGSHEFKIRNDGPGPLKMVARKEDHTCQCTLGSLGSEGLKPGEETTQQTVQTAPELGGSPSTERIPKDEAARGIARTMEQRINDALASGTPSSPSARADSHCPAGIVCTDPRNISAMLAMTGSDRPATAFAKGGKGKT